MQETEAIVIPLEDAKKRLEQDKKERGENCIMAIQAVLAQFKCEIIPVTTINGSQIDVSTLLKGELAFRLHVND